MVNPKTLTLKNGDIYAFGMGGKGRFETVHDVVASPKTNNNFPELIGADGKPTKNYTVTLTFRRAADLEPGMPKTPAKLGTQPQTTKTDELSLYLSNKTNENFGVTNPDIKAGPSIDDIVNQHVPTNKNDIDNKKNECE
jgi:hypothetical protein